MVRSHLVDLFCNGKILNFHFGAALKNVQTNTYLCDQNTEGLQIYGIILILFISKAL